MLNIIIEDEKNNIIHHDYNILQEKIIQSRRIKNNICFFAIFIISVIRFIK